MVKECFSALDEPPYRHGPLEALQHNTTQMANAGFSDYAAEHGLE